MVDAVLAKLSENFSRQPQSMQELFTVRLLAIRATLHRSVPGDEHKAADVHCLIYSHLLATLMAFFVRPRTVGSQDKVKFDSILLFHSIFLKTNDLSIVFYDASLLPSAECCQLSTNNL